MADLSLAPGAPTAHLHLLEGPTPLRLSSLWHMQRAFYVEQGVGCWQANVVPNFVTSNAFIAAAYARVVLGFLRDWFGARGGDRSQPVYLLEVGAGHGKFAFLLLRELMDAHESWPDLGFEEEEDDGDGGAGTGASASVSGAWRPRSRGADRFGVAFATEQILEDGRRRRRRRRAPFVVIISDFFDGSLPFWEAHESLQPFFEAGVLDVAVFDVEAEAVAAETEAETEAGGETGARLCLKRAEFELSRSSLRNPLICVCNYLFDTLHQDAFKLVDGQLFEAMAALYSRRAPDGVSGEGGGPIGLGDVQVAWSYRPTTPAQAYPRSCDAELRAVLAHYAARLPNASLLVPAGGIALLRTVAALGRGRVLLLAGDKSYNHEEELATVRDPHVALHGSFSFMANFNAVRLFTLACGGWSLQTPYFEGFKCSAFVLMEAQAPLDGAALAAAAEELLPAHALARFPQTCYAWADTMDTFGVDNFSTLQRCVNDEVPGPSLRLALSLVRMSNWDPDVFFKFKQTVIDKAPAASERAQADIYRDVRRVYERYYPLQGAKDVAFELGRVCMGLRRYAEAVQLFIASQRQCGEHHITCYNAGICLFHVGEMSAALACFDRSLTLRPDYADAQAWRLRATRSQAEGVAAPAEGSA